MLKYFSYKWCQILTKCLLSDVIDTSMKFIMIAFLLLPVYSVAQQTIRARNIGIPFDGITGKYNAITDVAGVERVRW